MARSRDFGLGMGAGAGVFAIALGISAAARPTHTVAPAAIAAATAAGIGPVGCPGDLNGDLVVNSADFSILAANYGNSCAGDDADQDGYTVAQGDCDDNNPNINPGATEFCDGIDNDCDGQIDEGVCTFYYADLDQDGYGNPSDSVCQCSPSGIYTAVVAGDCNDLNASVHPGSIEVCGNGIDDNCDGQVDEQGGVGCTFYYRDLDADGYGDPNESACLCAPNAIYTTPVAGDCNDFSPSIHPGAVENCFNTIDDDCDGLVDHFDSDCL